MELQVIDTRPPLSAAIALAKKSPEGLPAQWRTDMAAMTAEVARKYFGALTEDAVRDGLEATVNLLSMGLLRSTDGAVDPAEWVQTLRSAGVRGVSKLAVELIKTCDALPDYSAVFAGVDQYRPSLLLLLLSHASKQGAARAYSFLQRETAERREVKRLIALAEWLFANTASGRIARRNLETFFGTESPEAEQVLYHTLSLACGVAKADPYAEPSLTDDGPPEMMADEMPVHRLTAQRYTEARKRYEDLVEKIPADLREALAFGGIGWFDRFIQRKGKAAAKTKLPKAKA